MYKAATQIESIIMLKNPFSKTQPEFDKRLWYKGVTIIILSAFLFSVIDSIYYKINSQYNILDFIREHLQMPVLISYILICRILIRKKFGDIIYTYTDSSANNKNDCEQIVSHRICQSKWMEYLICLCTIVVGYVLFQPWKTNVGHINSIYLYSVEGIFFGLIGWYIYIFFNNVRILSDLNSKYVQDDLEITPPNIFQPSCFSDITEWSLKIIIFMIGLVILTLFLTPKYMFEGKEYIYYVLYFLSMLTSIFIFIYSMWNAHTIIRKIKTLKLMTLAEDFESTFEMIHNPETAQNSQIQEALSNRLVSLIAFEKKVKKISVWPYYPSDLGKLVFSCFAPIIFAFLNKLTDIDFLKKLIDNELINVFLSLM